MPEARVVMDADGAHLPVRRSELSLGFFYDATPGHSHRQDTRMDVPGCVSLSFETMTLDMRKDVLEVRSWRGNQACGAAHLKGINIIGDANGG
ncbi:hypothetical protein ABZP36_022262 [Zizania latifolia]